jgi:hypothetical protein
MRLKKRARNKASRRSPLPYLFVPCFLFTDLVFIEISIYSVTDIFCVGNPNGMDPVTALNLASSILSFVDYATKIVIGTYEVYKSVSGTTEENAHIDTVIGDLREATYDLDSNLVGKTKHEKALKELASKCETLSDELSRLLKKLAVSGDHSTWKSLKVKIKSMRKEKEVAGMEKRLGEYRSEILLRLTLILK